FMSTFAADAIPLDLAGGDGSENLATSGETGLPEYDLFEGQGSLEEVLDSYLGEDGGDGLPSTTEPAGEGTAITLPASAGPAQDPLGYLTTDQRDELDGGNLPVV